MRLIVHRILERLRVWMGYVRAWGWAFCGAKIGERVAIDASCYIDRAWRVSIGNRTRLERYVWLKLVADDAILNVGDHVFIGTGTEIDVMERVEIGDHSLIAPRCFITDHTHSIAREQRIDEQGCVSSAVFIGADVWIGAGTSILAGVTIGDGAVVGANSVVRNDVAPMTVVAGAPARKIGNRN